MSQASMYFQGWMIEVVGKLIEYFFSIEIGMDLNIQCLKCLEQSWSCRSEFTLLSTLRIKELLRQKCMVYRDGEKDLERDKDLSMNQKE